MVMETDVMFLTEFMPEDPLKPATATLIGKCAEFDTEHPDYARVAEWLADTDYSLVIDQGYSEDTAADWYVFAAG